MSSGPNEMPPSFQDDSQYQNIVIPENTGNDVNFASVGDYEFGLEMPNIYLENSKGPNNFFFPSITIEEDFYNKYTPANQTNNVQRITPSEPYASSGQLNYQLLSSKL